ncbi:molybdenum cofactor biosynthesis protein MoaA [Oceanicola sp. 22II-s10i]|uniref:molybdopterin molybdotransferase MoeA n=1 Tax=Oceanicola sp. 22II-s10i TaxID=1317116 RepID=UPI000B5255DE|nr:gephyrin-like molybdotransferase Glp [Oceanicola sp. 22II-s10i]OWU83848.1 molybdenum cofactor biosynthesis protein MoaA [Oceanicola sp. 22II-s10i]
MISVEEALAGLFGLVTPLGSETVPLTRASGRVLAEDIVARRDQPPFAASAMDGYAVIAAEAVPGATFRVIGEAAAGARHAGKVGPGEAVRIFTGAPMPEGADRVVIQEDTERDGDTIRLTDALDEGPHVRAAGGDFRIGDRIAAPRRLTPADIALAAAMNHPALTVTRRPAVALIATGDELVMPGEEPGPDQIVASNSFGLKALLETEGAEARLLPAARDNEPSLRHAFALAESADLIVTIGGASVGDHDLVGKVASDMGLDRQFWKVAMRPGKPLMAGRLNGTPMIGLPGNPVSAMLCGHVFLRPVIRAMLGLPAAGLAPEHTRLAAPVAANGPRTHYMRAEMTPDGIRAFDRQDSALLSVLARADCFLIREPNAPALEAGATVPYLLAR